MSGSSGSDERFDVVVVGARCAGSSAAIRLARSGLRVALVDADVFPSDAISTHVVFPDSIIELEELGVLARLQARHRLAPVRYSWRVLGQDVAGTFTPIGGRDRCLSVRRITLDAILVQTAKEAGAVLFMPHRVVGVLGAGTTSDPARGVVLDDGRHLLAPWVVGADGQRSTVARRLGLPATREQRGEMAFLLGYWQGLPPSDWCILDIRESSTLMPVPVEDGLHLLNVVGPPDVTRGGRAEVEARYDEALRSFPGVLNPRLLTRAALISPVVAVPETMMRGYRRPASGPGGLSSATRATSSTRRPPRASATPSSRPGTSPRTSSAAATSPGSRRGGTHAQPVTTSGPSGRPASPSPRTPSCTPASRPTTPPASSSSTPSRSGPPSPTSSLRNVRNGGRRPPRTRTGCAGSPAPWRP